MRRGTLRRAFRARRATQVRGWRGPGRPGFAGRRLRGRRWPRKVARPRASQDPRGPLLWLRSPGTSPLWPPLGEPASVPPAPLSLFSITPPPAFPWVSTSPYHFFAVPQFRLPQFSPGQLACLCNWFCFCSPPRRQMIFLKSDLNPCLLHTPTHSPVPTELPPVAKGST